MKLDASRCKSCRRAVVPPRKICPYCGPETDDMDSVELDGYGTVISYTTLQMPPEGFDDKLKMALVELEFGAVVLCLSKDDFDPEVEIGSKVVLSFDDEKRLRFHPA